VGAILYECLAGRPPHVGRSYEQVIVHICTRDVDDVRTEAPEVPAEIAAVVARSLAREREQRFATAADFLDALVAAAPEDVRDRYLKPLVGLDNISLRPASSSSSTRKRVSGAGLTPAEQVAATTPIGRSRDHTVDGLAETVRAQSSPGLRSAEPATLPAAALKPRLGPRIAVVGGIGLALGVALVFALRGSSPPGAPGDPAATSAPADAAAATTATSTTAVEPGSATASVEPASTGSLGPLATSTVSTSSSAAGSTGPGGKTVVKPKASASAKAPPVSTKLGIWDGGA
jgi:serine/threonine-protein kinase